jgi:hypothetical protein
MLYRNILYNHVYVFIYSLANRKHFYISPLKDSPFKAPPSPSILYNHVYVFIYSLATRKHFYISPLKDSPFKAPPSPSILYNHVYVFIYSLANRKHFYISPLKDSPFKAPPSPSQMTPRSRQLYSFGEGVGVSYNDIYVICILGKTNKKLCFHLPYQL